MAEPRVKKGELRVEQVDLTVGELTGLIKENYIAGIELSLSIYNENVKLLEKQIESWLAVQHDCAYLMKEFLGKFPVEGTVLWGGSIKNPIAAQVDWYFSLQNGYLELFKNTFYKFPKEAASMGRRNVESAFSVFDDFLNFFEGFGK